MFVTKCLAQNDCHSRWYNYLINAYYTSCKQKSLLNVTPENERKKEWIMVVLFGWRWANNSHIDRYCTHHHHHHRPDYPHHLHYVPPP